MISLRGYFLIIRWTAKNRPWKLVNLPRFTIRWVWQRYFMCWAPINFGIMTDFCDRWRWHKGRCSSSTGLSRYWVESAAPDNERG